MDLWLYLGELPPRATHLFSFLERGGGGGCGMDDSKANIVFFWGFWGIGKVVFGVLWCWVLGLKCWTLDVERCIFFLNLVSLAGWEWHLDFFSKCSCMILSWTMSWFSSFCFVWSLCMMVVLVHLKLMSNMYIHIDYLYILLSISQIIATSHDLTPKKGRAGTKNLQISSEAFSSIWKGVCTRCYVVSGRGFQRFLKIFGGVRKGESKGPISPNAT